MYTVGFCSELSLRALNVSLCVPCTLHRGHHTLISTLSTDAAGKFNEYLLECSMSHTPVKHPQSLLGSLHRCKDLQQTNDNALFSMLLSNVAPVAMARTVTIICTPSATQALNCWHIEMMPRHVLWPDVVLLTASGKRTSDMCQCSQLPHLAEGDLGNGQLVLLGSAESVCPAR